MTNSDQQKHSVTFLAPDAVIAETFSESIDEWDTATAVEMAAAAAERLGVQPFAFYFRTDEVGADGADIGMVAVSGRHYLGGEILCLAAAGERYGARPFLPIGPGSRRESLSRPPTPSPAGSYLTATPM